LPGKIRLRNDLSCVEWDVKPKPKPGGIQTLSARPTGDLQCFDTVGLVI